MSFNTVGEIVKALQEFDPSTPVLKLDVLSSFYLDIDLTAPLVFRVKPALNVSQEHAFHDVYDDAERTDPKGFDAIVL